MFIQIKSWCYLISKKNFNPITLNICISLWYFRYEIFSAFFRTNTDTAWNKVEERCGQREPRLRLGHRVPVALEGCGPRPVHRCDPWRQALDPVLLPRRPTGTPWRSTAGLGRWWKRTSPASRLSETLRFSSRLLCRPEPILLERKLSTLSKVFFKSFKIYFN